MVNNATTLKDAEDDDTPFIATKSIILRTEKLRAVMRNARPRLRCCVDPWWKDHPGEPLRALLRIEIDKDGSLRSATIDESRSLNGSPEVNTCLLAVAHQLDYPPSPADKTAIFEFPIQTK